MSVIHPIKNDLTQNTTPPAWNEMIDYGEFLKRLTAATPGLAQWDGTLKITKQAIKATGWSGGVFDLGLIDVAFKRNSNEIVNSSYSYLQRGTARYSIPGAPYNPYQSGLWYRLGYDPVAYGFDHSATTTGAFATVRPYKVHLMLRSKHVNIQQGLALPFGDLSQLNTSANPQQWRVHFMYDNNRLADRGDPGWNHTSMNDSAPLIEAMSGHCIGSAVLLNDGRVLMFPANQIGSEATSLGILGTNNSVVTTNWTYEKVLPTGFSVLPTTVVSRTHNNVIIRNNAGTVFYASVTTPTWSNNYMTKATVGSGGAITWTALPVDPEVKEHIIGVIDKSDDTCVLIANNGNAGFRTFNKLTGRASSTSLPKRQDIPYAGVKTIGDGIGIAYGKHGTATDYATVFYDGLTKIREYTTTQGTTLGNQESQGAIYLGNKIYHLGAWCMTIYELVGVGAPPIEFQLHPYMNHS
jgi:hypothetical protein